MDELLLIIRSAEILSFISDKMRMAQFFLIFIEVSFAYSSLRESAMTSLGIATIPESKSTRFSRNALQLIIAYKLYKDPCSPARANRLEEGYFKVWVQLYSIVQVISRISLHER